MSSFSYNKINKIIIITISSFVVISIYMYITNNNSIKSNNSLNNTDLYGSLPKDMNDNSFNDDYKQFLSNSDIISTDINKLEKDISQ